MFQNSNIGKSIDFRSRDSSLKLNEFDRKTQNNTKIKSRSYDNSPKINNRLQALTVN